MKSLWEAIAQRPPHGANGPRLLDQEATWSFGRLASVVAGYAAALRDARLGPEGVLVVPTAQRWEDIALLLAASTLPLRVLLVDRRELAAAPVRTRLAAALPGRSVLAEAGELLRLESLNAEQTSSAALPEVTFLLQLTSGSSGPRKLAMHSQDNLLRMMEVYREIWSLTACDRLLIPIPVEHSFGLIGGVLAGLAAASSVTILPSSPPARLLRHLAAERTTVLFGAPPLFELLWEISPLHRGLTFEARLCLSSGAAMTPQARACCVELFGRAPAEVYGSTEAGIVAATWPDSTHPLRLVPGVVARSQLVNEASLLEVCAAWLHLGYFDLETRTTLLRQAPYWLMGDVGLIGADGLVTLGGRVSTFINAGGRKINGSEVEAHLRSHPHVKDAHCYGISVAGGEELAALIHTATALSPTTIAAYCRESLGPGMTPSHVFLTTEPFRSANGKVPKERLPELQVRGGVLLP